VQGGEKSRLILFATETALTQKENDCSCVKVCAGNNESAPEIK